MEIKVPCTKINTTYYYPSSEQLSFSEDGNIMYRHDRTATKVYSLSDMKMLEKFPKKIHICEDGNDFYRYESQTEQFYNIKGVIIITTPKNITIITNGRVKIFDDHFHYCTFHRDHMYYLAINSDITRLTLKRIQLHNIDFDEIKVEVMSITRPYFIYGGTSMKADDKNNRLLICHNSCMLIFNLDNMKIEREIGREIGRVCNFTNENAICFNTKDNTLIILDLFSSSSNIKIMLPDSIADFRWPRISGKHIIVTLPNLKHIYNIKGEFLGEIHEEEDLAGNHDVMFVVGEKVIVVYSLCICVYDISRLNKENKK